jgi:hypothetical protein
VDEAVVMYIREVCDHKVGFKEIPSGMRRVGWGLALLGDASRA